MPAYALRPAHARSGSCPAAAAGRGGLRKDERPQGLRRMVRIARVLDRAAVHPDLLRAIEVSCIDPETGATLKALGDMSVVRSGYRYGALPQLLRLHLLELLCQIASRLSIDDSRTLIQTGGKVSAHSCRICHGKESKTTRSPASVESSSASFAASVASDRSAGSTLSSPKTNGRQGRGISCSRYLRRPTICGHIRPNKTRG